jgi:hypothetical protein
MINEERNIIAGATKSSRGISGNVLTTEVFKEEVKEQ